MIFHDLVYQGTTILLPKELANNFSSSWWILFMKIKSVLYCLKWWGKPSFYCCLSLRFCQVYSIIRGNLTHASFSSFSLEYLAPVVIRRITGLKRNEYIFCPLAPSLALLLDVTSVLLHIHVSDINEIARYYRIVWKFIKYLNFCLSNIVYHLSHSLVQCILIVFNPPIPSRPLTLFITKCYILIYCYL